MAVDRRRFLTSTALGLTAATLAKRCGVANPPAEANGQSVDDFGPADPWSAIRDQFRLSPDTIHLSALLIASHPHPRARRHRALPRRNRRRLGSHAAGAQPRSHRVGARRDRGRHDADRVLLSIDGVHGFGIEDIDLGDLDLDLFSAGCHSSASTSTAAPRRMSSNICASGTSSRASRPTPYATRASRRASAIRRTRSTERSMRSER